MRKDAGGMPNNGHGREFAKHSTGEAKPVIVYYRDALHALRTQARVVECIRRAHVDQSMRAICNAVAGIVGSIFQPHANEKRPIELARTVQVLCDLERDVADEECEDGVITRTIFMRIGPGVRVTLIEAEPYVIAEIYDARAPDDQPPRCRYRLWIRSDDAASAETSWNIAVRLEDENL